MIFFNYNTEFALIDEDKHSKWLSGVVKQEDCKLGELNYIFCSDEELYEINVKYLNHNTLTDVISFDYTVKALISGDIYISIDRVAENAKIYDVSFNDELSRVMVHGLLHFCGYRDKSAVEQTIMRGKEDYYLNIR